MTVPPGATVHVRISTARQARHVPSVAPRIVGVQNARRWNVVQQGDQPTTHRIPDEIKLPSHSITNLPRLGLMKRQARPFTVEVKRKRGVQERGRSIWGGIDLSAVATEMAQSARSCDFGQVEERCGNTAVVVDR